MGVSIGVFVAFLPTIGFQMGLAWVIGSVFNASRPAAMSAVWLTNPWTAGPIYALTYMIGRPFWFGSQDVGYWELTRAIQGTSPSLGVNAELALIHNVFGLGTSMLIPMLIGGIIAGVTAGFFSYYPSKWIASSYQRFKRRHASKTHTTEADEHDVPHETHETAEAHESSLDYRAYTEALEYFADQLDEKRKAA